MFKKVIIGSVVCAAAMLGVVGVANAATGAGHAVAVKKPHHKANPGHPENYIAGTERFTENYESEILKAGG